MNKPEYFHVMIGPLDRDWLDKKLAREGLNGESSIRVAAQSAFYKLAGFYAKNCYAGWGTTPKQVDAMLFYGYDDETKNCIVWSYLQERKEMPPHIRAWALLMVEQKRLKK